MDELTALQMRISRIAFLNLFLIFALASCGSDQQEAEDSASPPTVKQERATPPVPQSAPSRLEKEIGVVKADETTEEILATIRETYAAITSKKELEVLRKELTEFECVNDPGSGTLTRYYDREELVILHLSTGSDHSWESDMVYFSEGEPFFVFREEGYWQFGGPLNEDGNPNTIDKIMEERLYLKDGKVLKAFDKGYDIKSWEEEVNSDDVPNKLIPELIGKEYEKMGELGEWVMGEVGC